ncbi:MAG TPA: ATP-binding protein [Gemmataceae bacterium]|nr:ATP-binding protein [Gemmataceae bacterium]
MNLYSTGDAAEVEMGRQEPPRSVPVAIHRLLSPAASGDRILAHWLAEIAKALNARHVALAGILEREAVVQYFFPQESEFLATLSWPWVQQQPLESEFWNAFPARATQSADGRSSFLMTAVRHGSMLWVLCMETAHPHTWTDDDQAALTLAGLGLFQFAVIPGQAQQWEQWSKKVEIQQRLEQSALVVGRLVHDFNNVLTGILGFTELSLAQMPAGGTQRNFMTEVYAGAQQGSQMLNRLGLFSARKSVPPGLMTALEPVWAEEQTRRRAAWGDAISWEVIVPRDLPALAIDADALRVLFDKLLENAREAITSNGKITLAARQVELTREDCLGLLGKACPGSYVEITIVDSGRGLSAEARCRIFTDPFFSTKPRHRGLGLASVYGLMNNYGGGIRVEPALPSGTQARVYVPTARRAAEALVPSKPSPGRAARTEGGSAEKASVAIDPLLCSGRRVG